VRVGLSPSADIARELLIIELLLAGHEAKLFIAAHELSQCGLSAHLMAVLGVDVMGWVLGPIGSVVTGVDKWSI
jgi:hypothetical protein